MEGSLEGRGHPAPPQQTRFPSTAGPSSRSTAPSGKRREKPGMTRGAPGNGNADTQGDRLLAGRFAGSNFPVQTDIHKLLRIDYIYPSLRSPPGPARRLPPAAAAPPRPAAGAPPGSSDTSRGKCQQSNNDKGEARFTSARFVGEMNGAQGSIWPTSRIFLRDRTGSI